MPKSISFAAAAALLLALAACGESSKDEAGGPSIEVTAGAPLSIPAAPTSPAIEPACAFDGTKLMVVYAQDDGTGSHDIYYVEQPLNGAFSLPTVLESTPGLDSRHPACAVDSSGTLHVVWEEATGTANREIHYATRTSVGAISALNLSSTPSTDEASPRVYVDQADRVHFVWESAGDIYYKRKATTFSAAVMLPHATGGLLGQTPDVCGDSADRIYVVWPESVGVQEDLRILRSDPGGTFGEVSGDGMAVRGTVLTSEPRLGGGGNGQVFLTFIGQANSGDRGLFFTYTIDGGANFTHPAALLVKPAPNVREPSIFVRARVGDTEKTVMIGVNDGTSAGGQVKLFCSRDSGANFSGGGHDLTVAGVEMNINTRPAISFSDTKVYAAWMGRPTSTSGSIRIMSSASGYTLP